MNEVNRLIDECPSIEKYGVGDCEMLPREAGGWMHVNNIRRILDWLEDNDNREVLLEKIAHLRSVI